MQLIHIFAIISSAAFLGHAAPLPAAEDTPLPPESFNTYGTAHTLKMADDATRRDEGSVRPANEFNAYGTAHALKMVGDATRRDEGSVRPANEFNAYGTAHTLKMADDATK